MRATALLALRLTYEGFFFVCFFCPWLDRKVFSSRSYWRGNDTQPRHSCSLNVTVVSSSRHSRAKCKYGGQMCLRYGSPAVRQAGMSVRAHKLATFNVKSKHDFNGTDAGMDKEHCCSVVLIECERQSINSQANNLIVGGN